MMEDALLSVAKPGTQRIHLKIREFDNFHVRSKFAVAANHIGGVTTDSLTFYFIDFGLRLCTRFYAACHMSQERMLNSCLGQSYRPCSDFQQVSQASLPSEVALKDLNMCFGLDQSEALPTRVLVHVQVCCYISFPEKFIVPLVVVNAGSRDGCGGGGRSSAVDLGFAAPFL